jgi:hypothetical protein
MKHKDAGALHMPSVHSMRCKGKSERGRGVTVRCRALHVHLMVCEARAHDHGQSESERENEETRGACRWTARMLTSNTPGSNSR